MAPISSWRDFSISVRRLHAKAVYKTFGIDIDALEFVFGREFDKL